MAIDWDRLKSHYLKANWATQLDSLALNLRRIQVLAGSDTDELVMRHWVRESQFFIEWIVPNIDLERDVSFETELVELQRLLSCWKLDGSDLWETEDSRRKIAALARQWCDRIVHRSNTQAQVWEAQ